MMYYYVIMALKHLFTISVDIFDIVVTDIIYYCDILKRCGCLVVLIIHFMLCRRYSVLLYHPPYYKMRMNQW